LFHEVTVLPGSSRGDGGFGSTGLAGVGGFIPPRGVWGDGSPQDRGGHRGGRPPGGD
jgi:hypothetical protein